MKFKQTILISMILLFFSCNKKEYVDSLNGIYLWKDSENSFELLSFKTNGELTSTMCDKGTVYQDISGVYEINGPDLTLRLNEINKTTYATYELDEEDIYIIDEYSKARLYKHQQNNPYVPKRAARRFKQPKHADQTARTHTAARRVAFQPENHRRQRAANGTRYDHG